MPSLRYEVALNAFSNVSNLSHPPSSPHSIAMHDKLPLLVPFYQMVHPSTEMHELHEMHEMHDSSDSNESHDSGIEFKKKKKLKKKKVNHAILASMHSCIHAFSSF